MIALPRLLYFFANIPIWLPPSWFQELDCLIRDLIWDTGRRRAALRILRLPVTSGGLGVPDFQYYYWAAQFQWIARWVKGVHTEEMGLIGDDQGRAALIWRLVRNRNLTEGGTCLLKVAMKCWNKCTQTLQPSPIYAPETPLVGLPRLVARMSPFYTSRELTDWTEAGVLTVGDCYASGELLPFDTLVELTGLPTGQFLKYESLKKSIRALWGGIGEETPIHLVLQRVLTMGKGRHLITWLYKALIDMRYKCPKATRNRWERDMGLIIDDRDWNTCLEQVKRVSRNSRMKYTQFNYVHQCYLDPLKIAKMFGGPTRPCPRCGSLRASFYHMVWECVTIEGFWTRVVAHINRTLHRGYSANPLGCLLGVMNRPAQRKAGNRLTDLAFVVARKSIAKYWKSPAGPSYVGWVHEMGKWCRAEEELIIKEERIGTRLQMLSPLWKEVIEAFAMAVEGNENTEGEQDLQGEKTGSDTE